MKKNWKLKGAGSNSIDAGLQKKFEKATLEIFKSKGLFKKKQIEEFLEPSFKSNLNDPWLLSGMRRAVERVLLAIKRKQKICVFGDYDADGVTSTVLLLDFFGQIGILPFMYIPDRNSEGYGLNKEAIDYIKKRKADLIITVDCGISNIAEVEHAKKRGIDVIVLDHHHVPAEIPKAFSVVDPKKKGDEYPEKFLAGVGVVFKFVQALAQKMGNYDGEQLKWLLDLVAIGTVADCVPLRGENRILVKYGLVVLGKTKRVGLKQLFHVGRIQINNFSHPTSQQIGFQVAPRINAAGRMDHANIAMELLSCKQGEEAKARILALEIEEKNKHRQKVTEAIIKEAVEKIKEKEKPHIIIEKSPSWELGVVGLAAGKIAEKYHCPTILFQEKNGVLRGSGRSVNDFNMIEIIEKFSKLLESFGGHAQAFGLKVSRKKYPLFKKTLKEELQGPENVISPKKVLIDAEVRFSVINEKLVNEISLMEPFGRENEKPNFLSRNVLVREANFLGNGKKHLKLLLEQGENGSFCAFEMIGFGLAEKYGSIRKGDLVDVVYGLEKHEWNGFSKIQGVLIDIDKC